MIEIKNLEFNLSGNEIIKNFSADINNGEILGIIGKSGSGKTILLKILSGSLKKFEGEILIDNVPLKSLKTKEILKNFFYMNKIVIENTEDTLHNFLTLSRLPFKKILNPFSDYDLQIVDENIELMELTQYKNHPLSSLPDCIIQRLFIAFSLARRPEMLFLDNPTSEMDLRSVYLTYKALMKYTISSNHIIVIASNDLNFISQICDRILILKDGELAREIEPGRIDTEIIKKYFNREVIVSKNIYNGRPNIHFFPEN